MLVLGMAFIFAGYSVGSYGWVLLRGYDIPLRAWFSPLHPYTWPSGTPPTIPDTQLFPGSSQASTTSTSGGSGAGVSTPTLV